MENSGISDVGAMESSEMEEDSTSSTFREGLKQKLISLQAEKLLTDAECQHLIALLSNDNSKQVSTNIEEMNHKLPDYGIVKMEDNGRKSLKDVDTKTSGNAVPCTKAQRNYLKKQFRLGQNQDKKEVNKVMCETFEDRRNYILFKGPRIRKLQEEYATLFQKDQLLAEFGRITQKDIVQTLYDNLRLHCDAILQSAQPTCLAMKTLTKVRDAVQAEGGKEKKQYMNFAAALLALPSLFEESVGKIVQFKSVKCNTDYPIVLCKLDADAALTGDASFNIYAERVLLSTSKDLIETFLIFMASFYIFDISYPSAIVQTTTLVELLLLDLPPDANNMCTSVEEVNKMLRLLTKASS